MTYCAPYYPVPQYRSIAFRTLRSQRTAHTLMPTIHQFPPQQPQPLIKIYFCPFPVLPPFRAKLTLVKCGRHTEIAIRDFTLKDAESPPGVIVGSDQQD